MKIMRPTPDNNFGRVFELPAHYPEGFCFGGGKPVQMTMVDWFNPWPQTDVTGKEIETWEEVKELLLPFLIGKRYVLPGRQYILITDFGESMMFGHGCR
jgi:hypothetical protein